MYLHRGLQILCTPIKFPHPLSPILLSFYTCDRQGVFSCNAFVFSCDAAAALFLSRPCTKVFFLAQM
jgi:hypothetical protein